jgi:hypothetical protein
MITTLAHALTASSQSITLFDDVDLESGQLLALGSEYCRVLRVLTPTQALVQRGVNGTQARVQEAGITVTVGVPDDFLTGPQSVPVFGDDTDVLTANGPSLEATYQVSGGSGGGDTVIVDGVDNTIKATVEDYTNSNPLTVVLVDTNGDPYVASGGGPGSDVNLTGINTVTPSVGNGTSDTGTLRVAIASNNTAFAVTTGGLTDTQLRATPVPVSGTVTTGGLTDTQLRASAVPVSLTSTTVTGNVTVVQPTAASLNATVIGAGSAGTANAGVVTVQGIASMTKLLVTPDANSAVNVAQIAGTTTLTGNGVTGAGSQRVTIASDNTPFHVINDASSAVIGHVITDTGSTTAVTGNVTVVQTTGTSLHAVLDTTSTTAVTQATAANLNAAVVGTGTAGSAAGGVLTIQGVASMTKLLVTPDSVALPANQSVNVAQIAGTNTVTGGVAGIIAVGGNVANAATATANPVPVGGTFVTSPTTLTTGQTATMQFTAAQNIKNDVTTIAGTAADTNSGNKSAGTLRVVIATDQPQLTNKLLVTPDANSAINLAQVNGTTTVNGGSAAGILAVGGPNATNVAITGNPTNNGAQGVSSENAAVTTGRAVQLVADLVGKLIVLPYANPENFVSFAMTSAMTGTTSTITLAAPASGLRNYITQITVSNGSTTVSTDISIQDGSGGTAFYVIPAPAAAVATTGGGGGTFVFPTPLRQPTTATAVYVANVTTGSSTKVSLSGYKGA